METRLTALLTRPFAGLLSVGLGLVLVVRAWQAYPPSTVALVLASLALAGASAWSCHTLAGARTTRVFVLTGLILGWAAEQAGAGWGWFFGHYHYTEVLGPRLGHVPLVIPLMWFGLCHVGWVLGSLLLWQQPVPARASLRGRAAAAVMAALLVTAFDLGADPYFVFVLKAWIMDKTTGAWFGETTKGFAGWLVVSGTIVMVTQLLARPATSVVAPGTAAAARARWAAAVPLIVYGGLLVFQLVFTRPDAVRVVALFAMGIPLLAALAAWQRWRPAARPTPPPPGTPDPVPPARWARAEQRADPLADAAVAALIGPWPDEAGTGGPDTARLAQATRLMAGWTTNARLVDWAPPPGTDPVVARALQDYLAQGRLLPPWVDPVQVARAEQLFMDHGPLSCTLLFCASLPQCYVLPHLSQVLHIAGQLEAHTEHRIRQTAAMIFPVMMRGGLLGPEGGGLAQVLKVRLIHATIRHLILRGPPEAAADRVPPRPGPAAGGNLHAALAAHGWDAARRGLPANELEMAYTLLTFSYVFLDGLRTLGVGLPAEDEVAFLHAWNVVGHVLGIPEDLLAHDMDQAAAMFVDLQTRACAQPSDGPDVRPALGDALVRALAQTLRLPGLRHVPVPLTRWLIGARAADAVGIGPQAGWPAQALFQLGRLAVQGIDGLARLVWPTFSLSRLLTRVVGYHLLTRYLLDQTRPLNLPDELLAPLRATVASWHHDARAPAWVNRWEDRLTAPGPWRAPVPPAGTPARS